MIDYEQPQKYIVHSTEYSDEYSIPVLTAGQSFILGYTDEVDGVYPASAENPVIIFDDFTTSFHYVCFPFKVKSSAMKLLTMKREADCNFSFLYCAMGGINYTPSNHERHWISKYSLLSVSVPTLPEQIEIGNFFRDLDSLIEAKQQEIENLQKIKNACLNKMFV
jgi:type I restriction enzyme S subunit